MVDDKMSAADILSAQGTLEALADDPSDWATFAVRGAAENGARAIEALTARAEKAEGEVERLNAAPDYYEHKEALGDLVHLMSEEDALNGGGPGFLDRWKKAKRRAVELFEP